MAKAPAGEMPDEQELRLFRKWLHTRRQEIEKQNDAEFADEFEPVARSKERWLVSFMQAATWKLQALNLAKHAKEALIAAEKFSADERLWEETFKARLKTCLELGTTKISELATKLNQAMAESPSANTEEAKIAEETQMRLHEELRSIQRRFDQLATLRDYKPVARVLDIPLDSVKASVATDTEFASHVPDPASELDKFFGERHCQACGGVKLEGPHPLCLNCQQKYKSGKLSGHWTGVSAPAQSAAPW